MVNYPAITKSPDFFEEQVKELIKNINIKFESYGEEWLKENNMGGVVGVAQGSERPPKFLIGEYNPDAKKQIALIGKGVLFDSGGSLFEISFWYGNNENGYGRCCNCLGNNRTSSKTRFRYRFESLYSHS